MRGSAVPKSFNLLIPMGIAALFGATVFFASGCRDGSVPTEPVWIDDGMWIPDTTFTLDEFPFNTAACGEVYPEGSVNVDSVPWDAVAHVRIRATACYTLRVRVVDSDSDTVRTFVTRFGIFNRTESEKNRGIVGFAAWDGRDDSGAAVPRGNYLWRMEFDFGAGRIRKFRASFDRP
ncbi:MAG: hypothetical protein ABI036_14320 [Fibrobacteria bacterium]